MNGSVSSVVLFRALALGVLVVLAGCATPRGPAGGAPHYKVGEPYKVNGRWYKPKDEPGYEAVGIASWYGDEFDGRRTANGEIFDKNRLSAAHTTLPLPSLVEVRNLENGRSVVVRVNDRGPFVGDRLIDVSRAAAMALGFKDKGLARVRIRYLGRADVYARAESGGHYKARMRGAPPSPPVPKPVVASAAEPALAPTNASAGDPMATLIGEALAAAPRQEFWIAVGAFDDLNQLEAARIALPPLGETRVVMAPHADRAIRYELQIGPEFDPKSADARLAALREAGYSEARIVEDTL